MDTTKDAFLKTECSNCGAIRLSLINEDTAYDYSYSCPACGCRKPVKNSSLMLYNIPASSILIFEEQRTETSVDVARKLLALLEEQDTNKMIKRLRESGVIITEGNS